MKMFLQLTGYAATENSLNLQNTIICTIGSNQFYMCGFCKSLYKQNSIYNVKVFILYVYLILNFLISLAYY